MSTATCPPIEDAATTSLLTDRYELTMLDAALASGIAERRVTFEAFARSVPCGTGFGVVSGADRLAAAVEAFRFSHADLAFLEGDGVVSPHALRHLADWRFRGTISGYRDGELYFPDSPLVTVDATFGDAVLLETLVLSILNRGCAIATAAAEIVQAAEGRPVIEMGSRRTHEQAAVEAARAAWIAGFASTSNLEAGRRYGVPTTGTAAHAWTLLHDSEAAAFDAQIAALGLGTTLLVDTYSVEEGLVNALAAARRHGAPGPGAVRIDSGDLAHEARRARALLDAAGAGATRIVLTSDLDATAIRRLVADGVPVDAFGVGTRLVAAQPAGVVYKLVAVADASGSMRPVAKGSAGKATVGGRKRAYRVLDERSRATAELLVTDDEPARGRALQEVLVRRGGAATGDDPAATTRAARERHTRALAELAAPRAADRPLIPTVHRSA